MLFQFLKYCNLLRLMISNYLQYFTIINLSLIVFHQYTYKYINILFTSLLVSICGFVVFQVYPRSFTANITTSHNLFVKNEAAILVDIIFHQVPLAFVIWKYLSYYKIDSFGVSFIISQCIILVYLSTFNPYSIYRCKTKNIILLYVLSIVIYALLVQK